MNTGSELFGELHEQEETGLFGNEHRRQNEKLPHYFNAPDNDKSSRFCRCGKYLTDEIHLRP